MAILWILQRASPRRAEMHIAHLKVTNLRFFESPAQTKGAKRMARKGRLAAAHDRVRKAEDELGG